MMFLLIFVSQKIKETRQLIDQSGRDIRLEVDGGIGLKNLHEVVAAGANMFVAGSAIFQPPRTIQSYQQTITQMRQILQPYH